MTDLFNIPIYTINNNKIILPVYIKPISQNSNFIGIYNGRVKISISAPPREGIANKALIKFIANKLNIKQNEVIIIQGLSSSYKLLELPLLIKNSIDDIIQSM